MCILLGEFKLFKVQKMLAYRFIPICNDLCVIAFSVLLSYNLHIVKFTCQNVQRCATHLLEVLGALMHAHSCTVTITLRT